MDPSVQCLLLYKFHYFISAKLLFEPDENLYVKQPSRHEWLVISDRYNFLAEHLSATLCIFYRQAQYQIDYRLDYIRE